MHFIVKINPTDHSFEIVSHSSHQVRARNQMMEIAKEYIAVENGSKHLENCVKEKVECLLSEPVGHYIVQTHDDLDELKLYKRSDFVNAGWVTTSVDPKIEHLFTYVIKIYQMSAGENGCGLVPGHRYSLDKDGKYSELMNALKGDPKFLERYNKVDTIDAETVLQNNCYETGSEYTDSDSCEDSCSDSDTSDDSDSESESETETDYSESETDDSYDESDDSDNEDDEEWEKVTDTDDCEEKKTNTMA